MAKWKLAKSREIGTIRVRRISNASPKNIHGYYIYGSEMVNCDPIRKLTALSEILTFADFITLLAYPFRTHS